MPIEPTPDAAWSSMTKPLPRATVPWQSIGSWPSAIRNNGCTPLSFGLLLLARATLEQQHGYFELADRTLQATEALAQQLRQRFFEVSDVAVYYFQAKERRLVYLQTMGHTEALKSAAKELYEEYQSNQVPLENSFETKFVDYLDEILAE